MTTTTVNDALVKLDNVIEAANYLLEELQTRKSQLLQKENILDEVKSQMNTSDFKEDISYYIRNGYGNGICREVAFYVMERIDADIEAFINDRVSKAIADTGASQAQDQW
jgi:hypothetical protein